MVNKPPGWNTHAPSPFAGEGIYDWLKHREPRWANLAIIHRLDKETSGVMAFGKTPLANRSLTEQFTQRSVRKTYVLLTDRQVRPTEFTVRTRITRKGERYVARPHGEDAETRFKLCSRETDDNLVLHLQHKLVQAWPLTGRTHQIRVHAAERGFPILGDTLYGGSPFRRVCLHAVELTLRHPATGEELTFRAPADFEAHAGHSLRQALIEPEATDAFRLIHGASDGWPGVYVDRLGDFLLSQSEAPLSAAQQAWLARRGATTHHKLLTRHVRGAERSETSPRPLFGVTAPERFFVRENGVKFELSLREGYSVGLFLDQRDNRRRLLTGYVAAGFRLFVGQASSLSSLTPEHERSSDGDRLEACPTLLNVFAYTCGFSVCAALTGARTTSLDLSKKSLEWGKRNFALNGLDPAGHDFIYGDAFDWLRRLAKRGHKFDCVLLDPPTFSQSKAGGVFRAEKDFGKLVSAALPVLKPNGILFASSNAAGWLPEEFIASVSQAVRRAGRKIVQQHYAPQPPDFPISRAEPAYLKTVWLRIE